MTIKTGRTNKMTLEQLFLSAKETQDAKYNTWEISPVTGLQKQPDGTWKEPQKEQEQSQKEAPAKKENSVEFNYTESPNGEYYEVTTNSNKSKYKQFQIRPSLKGNGNYTALYVKTNKYGVKLAHYMPEIKAGTLENVKQQLEALVNGANQPKQKQLTAETKIKLSQIKPEQSKQQTTQKIEKPVETKKQEPLSAWEKEEQQIKERESEKPTLKDGYESWKGIINIDKKLRPKWEALSNKLSATERDAINTWADPFGGDPYIDIQAYTRDPTNYRSYDDGDRKSPYRLTNKKAEAIVKGMDSAFKKAPTVGTDLVVFSGQGNHSMFYNSLGIKETKDKLVNELQKHIGETITNKSYLSTSVNEKGAAMWHDTPVELRIKVPKDKKGIYLNAGRIDNYKYTKDNDENELLLNRGAKFKIIKAETKRNRAGKKAALVELELVDDGVKK